MAEQVQKNMELIMDEIQEMNRIKLFTAEETRKFLEDRRKFEYDLAGPTKLLEFYKNYIEYENNVLKLVLERRRKYRIADKKSDIDYRIRRRIKNLYENAMQKYADDDTLCLSYFNFGKAKSIPAACDSAVLTLLKRHASKEEVWVLAAKYYYTDKNDAALALQTLEKGRAFHKQSGLLYKEAFELEILKTIGKKPLMKEEENKKNLNKEDKLEKENLCVKRLLLYLEEMFDNIKNYQVYIDFLQFLEKHSFLKEIQIKIIEFVKREFKEQPEIWHAIAQNEWKLKPCLEPGESQPKTRTRIMACVQKYKEGLSLVVEHEARKKLWKYYIDFLIEVLRDEFASARQFKKTCLKEACEEAVEEKCLEENHYLQWISLIDGADPSKILEKATTNLPKSVEMWKHRLHHICTTNPSKEHLKQVAFEGIEQLKEHSLCIWTMLIRFLSLGTNKEEVQELFAKACQQPPSISSFIKPIYLEWLMVIGPINEARTAYLQMAQEKPYCRQLHYTMSKLERSQIEENFIHWEKVHKFAIEQFGDEDEDVWIQYIEFLKNYSKQDKPLNPLETIKVLYKQAESRLPAPSLVDFRHKFQQLKINL